LVLSTIAEGILSFRYEMPTAPIGNLAAMGLEAAGFNGWMEYLP
jgi:hypothetical protein